jgi:hypothetical protein
MNRWTGFSTIPRPLRTSPLSNPLFRWSWVDINRNPWIKTGHVADDTEVGQRDGGTDSKRCSHPMPTVGSAPPRGQSAIADLTSSWTLCVAEPGGAAIDRGLLQLCRTLSS